MDDPAALVDDRADPPGGPPPEQDVPLALLVESLKAGHAIDGLLAWPGRQRLDPWQRAELTATCTDADEIPKVPRAGSVVETDDGRAVQIMHNGVLIEPDCYYGAWTTRLIERLRGHHEPQEERVFHQVLARLGEGSTMIEMGAFWAYYSLWFHAAIPGARVICCEPDPENLEVGRRNAALNDADLIFRQGAAGSEHGTEVEFELDSHPGVRTSVPVLSVDGLLEEHGFDRLDLLHVDVQGAELDTLRGASAAIRSGCVRFVFVSTHHFAISRDPNLHARCMEFLVRHGAHVIAAHTIPESFSGDGLIVASFDERDRDLVVDVSLNHTDRSLYRPYEDDIEMSLAMIDSARRIIDEQRLVAEEATRGLAEQQKVAEEATRELLELRTSAEQAGLELDALQQTKTFRYTAQARGAFATVRKVARSARDVEHRVDQWLRREVWRRSGYRLPFLGADEVLLDAVEDELGRCTAARRSATAVQILARAEGGAGVADPTAHPEPRDRAARGMRTRLLRASRALRARAVAAPEPARHSRELLDRIEAFDATTGSTPAREAGPATEVRPPTADATNPSVTSVSEKLGVTVVGDLEVTTGLMEAGRGLIKTLLASGVDVSVYPFRTPVEASVTRRLEEATALPRGRHHDIEIWLLNVNELGQVPDDRLRPRGTDRYVIGSWFWEFGRLAPQYADAVQRVDEIWVASSFVQDTFRRSTSHPVTRLPCAVEPRLPPFFDRSEFGLRDDAIVFMFNFDAFSTAGRKNPFGLVSSYAQAFSETERRTRVQLLVKTHNLQRVPPLATALRAAMATVDGVLLDAELPRAKMNALIACSDVYASLHRCEGFGLGMAEAMYFGKPVIATAFSANTDFTTFDNSCLVGYQLRELVDDDHRYFPEAAELYPAGLQWAEPDLAMAARWMRVLADDPDLRAEIGNRGAATIRQQYSTKVAAAQVRDRLAAIARSRY